MQQKGVRGSLPCSTRVLLDKRINPTRNVTHLPDNTIPTVPSSSQFDHQTHFIYLKTLIHVNQVGVSFHHSKVNSLKPASYCLPLHPLAQEPADFEFQFFSIMSGYGRDDYGQQQGDGYGGQQGGYGGQQGGGEYGGTIPNPIPIRRIYLSNYR